MSNFTVHGLRIFARWEALNLGSLPHMRRRKLLTDERSLSSLFLNTKLRTIPALALKAQWVPLEGMAIGIHWWGLWEGETHAATVAPLWLSPPPSLTFQIPSLVLKWALSWGLRLGGGQAEFGWNSSRLGRVTIRPRAVDQSSSAQLSWLPHCASCLQSLASRPPGRTRYEDFCPLPSFGCQGPCWTFWLWHS